MGRRSPRTVWKFLLAELWRLILLTAAVLVTVIAFAVAVKPLADGKLGPFDTLRFMIMAIPPMLEYALPFAAGFGATLGYHRFASDNELTACLTGGVSYRSLLLPAALSGVVLSMFILTLSNQFIPRFLRQMEELVELDATRLIVNTVQRGDAVEIDDMLLYAKVVRRLGPDEGGVAFQRLWFGGMLLVWVDADDRVERELTARSATIWLTRELASDSADGQPGDTAGVTRVVVRPEDYKFRQQDGMVGSASDQVVTFTVPSPFRDDPKFLTWRELASLRDNPERMNFIDVRRRELVSRLAQQQAIEIMRRNLTERRRVELVDDAGRQFIVEASGMQYDPIEGQLLRPVTEGETVRIEQIKPARRGPNGSDTLHLSRGSGGDDLRAETGSAEPGRDQSAHLQLSHDDVGGPARRCESDEGSRLRRAAICLRDDRQPAAAELLVTARGSRQLHAANRRSVELRTSPA